VSRADRTRFVGLRSGPKPGSQSFVLRGDADERCLLPNRRPQCPECPESFKKDSQLRAHVALAHAPPGTKPFPCPVPACGKSFATAQKLRTHAKVHDATRYTCPDPAHDGEIDGPRPSFGTWSQLQAHQKEAHPPRCHYASCSDRPAFGSRKALRNHLKVHREREEDDALLGPEPASDASADEGTRGRKRRRSVSVGVGTAGGSGTGTPKLKRRRGESVAGKDWHCGDVGCGKSFKTVRSFQR
jgi:general transcription factor IIIA